MRRPFSASGSLTDWFRIPPMLWTVLVLIAMQGPQAVTPVRTGLILGRVVDGTSGRPISGAVVTLEGTTAASSTLPRAITNSAGQFVFRRLGRGAFRLTSTRNGFVDGAYGRIRPGGTTLPVELDEGQRVNDVVIRMWKCASISGSVTDEAGEPLIGVQVRAFQRRTLSGRSRILQAGGALTDDRGVYRFGSLAPGEYLVAFVAREVTIPMSSAEMLRSPPDRNDPAYVELNRSRIILGINGLPIPGMSNSIIVGDLIRQFDIDAPAPPRTEAPGTFIYPTQFFPGVPNAAKAAALALDSGQQRDNVDFTLRPARAVRVSGMIVGADGPVTNLALRLVPTLDEALTENLDTAATMAGPAGEFSFLGVPTGQSSIRALRVPQRPLPSRPPGTTTQIQIGSSVMISNNVSGADGPPPMPAHPPRGAADARRSDVVRRRAGRSDQLGCDGCDRDAPTGCTVQRARRIRRHARTPGCGRAAAHTGSGRARGSHEPDRRSRLLDSAGPSRRGGCLQDLRTAAREVPIARWQRTTRVDPEIGDRRWRRHLRCADRAEGDRHGERGDHVHRPANAIERERARCSGQSGSRRAGRRLSGRTGGLGGLRAETAAQAQRSGGQERVVFVPRIADRRLLCRGDQGRRLCPVAGPAGPRRTGAHSVARAPV